MNRTIAAIAFLVFAGFVGILVVAVPSPDLIAVSVLTVGLAFYDLLTSSGRRN
ncbi:hypothetical protein [Jannaschia rubra]|uniref:Uncharacterized protein n=1 Tax=Jannaschia rubra TaxID=282197 RepID=A0A0M6XPQ8_9RHOB|nr:hypothetical protein [Jannaschia rubra]CTQ33089.1 hypothetical protein JAN5088_01866 [Jannaschia rubra]SFG74330.1 hypothetical protein SAMN04488517_11335 [Jannaschia rubra]